MKQATYKEKVDRSLVEGGCWERCTFTVPSDTPASRVESHFMDYIRKAAEHFERQGALVLEYTWPILSLGKLPTDGDRKRYDFWLWCRRKPQTLHMEVDERIIPDMLQKGLKLA